MPQFYICDVCRLNYDFILHTEDDVDSKSSIIDQLDLGIKLLSRDEYYKVRIQLLFGTLSDFRNDLPRIVDFE